MAQSSAQPGKKHKGHILDVFFEEFYSGLAVEFPKTVRIENKRLAIMYYLLTFGAIITYLYFFIVDEAYIHLLTPSGRVFFWVSSRTWDVSAEEARKINKDFGTSDICATPSRYEYCDVQGCSGSYYKEMKCEDICTDEIVEDCTDKTERWYKEDRGIFFPLYYNETITTSASGQKTALNKQRILKGVEQMVLSFDHEYQVWGTETREAGNNKDMKGNLLTVLLDEKGGEHARWLPGETVAVPLRTMLNIAGLSLDTVKSNYGPNFLEGAEFSQGILARLAGAEIDVELLYTNRGSGWQGTVCYIRINTAVAWTSKPMVDAFDSSTQRLRYYQGLRVRFKSGGTFGEWNLANILGGLTSCLVFVGATKRLTKLFALTCLGALSRIYRRFMRQEASVENDCCGLAARLTSHTSGFMELKDHPEGVSKDRLQRRFERIFADEHSLNKVEIQRFTDYVFARMTKEGETNINVDEYARACALGEMVSVKSLIEIFDADRKKPFLERLFLDQSVRALNDSDHILRGDLGNQKSAVLKSQRRSASQQLSLAEAASPHKELHTAPDLSRGSTIAILTSGGENPAGTSEEALEEEDQMEMLQRTSDALKKSALKVDGELSELKGTMHAQRGEIDLLKRDIGEVHSSMASTHSNTNESNISEIQTSVKECQTKIEEFGRELQAVDALRAQFQVLEKSEQKYTSNLEFLHSVVHELETLSPIMHDVEKLKRQSEQLESEIAKLSKKNVHAARPRGMVVEETTRRVISEPSYYEAPAGAVQSPSDKTRENGTCGISDVLELCSDRDRDRKAAGPTETINIQPVMANNVQRRNELRNQVVNDLRHHPELNNQWH